MILVLAILLALSGWGSTIAIAVVTGQDKDRLERDLAYERVRCDNLTAQIQANSQGYAHVPQWTGPATPAEERHVMFDDTGLIEVEFDPDEVTV